MKKNPGLQIALVQSSVPNQKRKYNDESSFLKFPRCAFGKTESIESGINWYEDFKSFLVYHQTLRTHKCFKMI